jgi:hypothetical protein
MTVYINAGHAHDLTTIRSIHFFLNNATTKWMFNDRKPWRFQLMVRNSAIKMDTESTFEIISMTLSLEVVVDGSKLMC